MNRSATAAPDFAFAETRQGELNDRQRQILDLLVAGRTNGEIAETLGISFDGAKWNVSEILTKLGLESREDAAAFWRWRRAPHRRASRMLRSLLGTTAAKVLAGAGGAGVLGTAILVFWLALGGGDSRTSGGGTGFQLEGVYYQRREGANFDLQSLTEADQGTISIVFVDGRRFMFSATNEAPRLDALDWFQRSDGNELWIHAPETGSSWDYQVVPSSLLTNLDGRKAFPAGVLLGPVDAPSVEDLVAHMSAVGARVERHEQVLGIDTAVIAYGPTWANGKTHTTGGTGRIWVDPKTMVVLRRSEEGNDGSIARWAEVTAFQAGEVQSLPAWSAPPGSVVQHYQSPMPPAPTWVPAGWPGPEWPIAVPELPAPFVRLVVPSGFEVEGAHSSGSEAGIRMTDGSGRTVSVDELIRPSLPDGLTRGQQVSLPGGVSGYLQDIGSNRALAFAKGQVSVLITATALSDRELVSLAEAMLH